MGETMPTSASSCLLLLVCSATLVSAIPSQHKKCGVDGYNVKGLRKGENDEPYQAQSPKGHYRYFFNFCGHAKGCYSQPSCQVRIREDGKEEIATVTTTGELYKMKWEKLAAKDFTHMESIGVGRFTDGVKVTYSIGPMQRSTTILVPCLDKNSDYEEGKVAGYTVEGPTLHYTSVYPSKHGCKLSLSQLPINFSTKHVQKHHAFGFFLFMGLMIYCCVGAWYKRERLGAQGMEMIPHIDSITAAIECTKAQISGDADGMGGMFNSVRGVGDDGL